MTTCRRRPLPLRDPRRRRVGELRPPRVDRHPDERARERLRGREDLLRGVGVRAAEVPLAGDLAVARHDEAVRLPDPRGLGDRVELRRVEPDRRRASTFCHGAVGRQRRRSTSARRGRARSRRRPRSRRCPSTPRRRSRPPRRARRPASMRAAAGEQVERVRERPAGSTSSASTAPLALPGVLTIRQAPIVPATARDSMPEPAPALVADPPDRLDQTRAPRARSPRACPRA